MPDLRYPIGPFLPPSVFSPEHRTVFISDIESTHPRLRTAVDGLSETQLLEPYRDGGWTIAQLVHHLADSHITSYVRFKRAATEDNPIVRAYDEARWAELPDAMSTNVQLSLTLIGVLDARWVQFLRSMTADQFARTFVHSSIGSVTLDWALARYSWHGRHHIAHITSLRERLCW